MALGLVTTTQEFEHMYRRCHRKHGLIDIVKEKQMQNEVLLLNLQQCGQMEKKALVQKNCIFEPQKRPVKVILHT